MKADRRAGGQTDRTTRNVVATIALVAGLLPACPPARLPAQNNPVVRSAVQLASEGRGDSAYRMVNAELARSRPGDSVYVEALFWRGRLATYGDSAERDLRRVAIEHSASPWADDALLQLSQLALAAGNPASAYQLAARLRSDYPGSDLKPPAALWAARAAFEIGQPRAACASLDTAAAEGGSDIEFVNRVTYYRSRCFMAMTAPVPGAAAPDTVRQTASVTDSPPSSELHYEVQVAAAATATAAQDLVDLLGRSGLRARVVRVSSSVHRVRLGPFATQAAADNAARAAARVAGGEPFVVRVP